MFEGEDQPYTFSSIPAAMWWATETLTTVGYGDMVPVTVPGKLLGGIVSIIGIGTLALFSGTITIAFLEEMKKHREQTGGDPDAWELAHPEESDGDSMGAGSGQRIEEGRVPFQGVCPRCGFGHPQASASLAPSK
jgi:voltage-gated potassium channel